MFNWTVDEALLVSGSPFNWCVVLWFWWLAYCSHTDALHTWFDGDALRSFAVVSPGLCHAAPYITSAHHLVLISATWVILHRVFASLGPLRDLLTHGAAAILVDSLIVVLSIVLMWIYAPALAAGVVMIHLCFALVQLAFLPKTQTCSVISGVESGPRAISLVGVSASDSPCESICLRR